MTDLNNWIAVRVPVDARLAPTVARHVESTLRGCALPRGYAYLPRTSVPDEELPHALARGAPPLFPARRPASPRSTPTAASAAPTKEKPMPIVTKNPPVATTEARIAALERFHKIRAGREVSPELVKVVQTASDTLTHAATTVGKLGKAVLTGETPSTEDLTKARQAVEAAAVALRSLEVEFAVKPKPSPAPDAKAAPSKAIRVEGVRLVLGVMTPAEARAELARRERIGA